MRTLHPTKTRQYPCPSLPLATRSSARSHPACSPPPRTRSLDQRTCRHPRLQSVGESPDAIPHPSDPSTKHLATRPKRPCHLLPRSPTTLSQRTTYPFSRISPHPQKHGDLFARYAVQTPPLTAFSFLCAKTPSAFAHPSQTPTPPRRSKTSIASTHLNTPIRKAVKAPVAWGRGRAQRYAQTPTIGAVG